jgi:hypothetical protein
LTDSTLRRWTFGEDGDTVFPNNISIDYGGGNNILYPRIIADSGKAFSVQGQGETGSAALAWSVDPESAGQYAQIGATKGGGDNLAKVVIQAQSDSGDGNTAKIWKFDETGALTIPGDIRSENAVNIDINLSDSTLRRWRFGEGGDLTFPDGTNQSTAYTGGGLPTVVNASFQITDQSFTPESVYAATPYSITVTPSSTSAPVSVTFNLSIVANTGEGDAGCAFKIYVNGSPVDSSELINFIQVLPGSYSAYPATYTFNFVPGTNSPTTIALWAYKTGSNGWKFSKGLPSKHVVTALVF